MMPSLFPVFLSSIIALLIFHRDPPSKFPRKLISVNSSLCNTLFIIRCNTHIRRILCCLLTSNSTCISIIHQLLQCKWFIYIKTFNVSTFHFRSLHRRILGDTRRQPNLRACSHTWPFRSASHSQSRNLSQKLCL